MSEASKRLRDILSVERVHPDVVRVPVIDLETVLDQIEQNENFVARIDTDSSTYSGPLKTFSTDTAQVGPLKKDDITRELRKQPRGKTNTVEE